jgi:hypothetical protein
MELYIGLDVVFSLVLALYLVIPLAVINLAMLELDVALCLVLYMVHIVGVVFGSLSGAELGAE